MREILCEFQGLDKQNYLLKSEKVAIYHLKPYILKRASLGSSSTGKKYI